MAKTEGVLTMFIYGENESRIELEFRPQIPSHLDAEGRMQWLTRLILLGNDNTGGIVKDAKFSRDWGCAFCGKPARETVVQTGFWTHLNPPRANSYIHAVCTTVAGPCLEMARSTSRERAKMTGHLSPIPAAPDDGTILPTLSACAGCERNVEQGTANGGKMTLQRCGGCHLTSDACQRDAWPKHKTACKSLKSLNWVL